jgi:hypothetical protein
VRRPRLQLLAAAAACAALAILLICFPPERYAFYPVCPIHEWLRLRCPGCGITRALAALLTGHIREAARQNALVLALVPASLWFGVLETYSVVRCNTWRHIRIPQHWASAACAAVLLFGLLRP